MFPILFKLGFIQIYSYGFMAAMAFLVSTLLLSRYVISLNLDKDFFWNLSYGILLGGILGGRLMYGALNLKFFLDNPGEIFMLWHGGLVWYGGFLGGLATAGIFLKSKKAPLFKTLDIIVPFAALGQAIGRIGCFLNGCCYGRAVWWGLYYPAHNDALIPAQLFSSLSLTAVFVVLRLLQERPHRTGFIVVMYLWCASGQRFIEEFLRNDSPRDFYGLTLFQVASIVIFLSALMLWCMILWLEKKPRVNG